jgi:pimeloyl-ACP methyl ester carboxylesterase
VDVRGKTQSLAIYDPAPGRVHPFAVLVTSGDLGWIGISVDIAEHLQKNGYRVAGFNARAYLSSFTGKSTALSPQDIPGDYANVISAAWRGPAAPPGVVLIGVSEGAGLAAVALGQGQCPKCKGLIALGLPRNTSLGWRWTDFPMWITKRDPKEPMADTREFLLRLKMPLVMIHSTHDEYDPIEKIRALFQQAPEPKRFIEVDAINHRFSDKAAEVLEHIDQSLAWFESGTDIP